MDNVCVWLCFVCRPYSDFGKMRNKKYGLQCCNSTAYHSSACIFMAHGICDWCTKRYEQHFHENDGISGAIGCCNRSILALLLQSAAAWKCQ